MLRILLNRLSYANVMSTVALFAAIGGGAYAAGLAKDSVGSKQIKDEAIKSVDVKDGAIYGQDVGEGEIDGRNVSDFSLTNDDISVFHATVNSNGQILRSSGGIESVPLAPAPIGAYVLRFPINVSGCTSTVSVEEGEGYAKTGIDIGFSADDVVVFTFNHTGGSQYRNFALTLVC